MRRDTLYLSVNPPAPHRDLEQRETGLHRDSVRGETGTVSGKRPGQCQRGDRGKRPGTKVPQSQSAVTIC